MTMNEQKSQKKPTSISTRLFVAIGICFLTVGFIIVFLLNYQMKHQALVEAESKARIILDRNLAIHTYFTHQLKPKLFKLTNPIAPDEYFEPVWMSSTYAVREMDKYFRSLSPADYYYKECAIDARSPDNEADAYERNFLEELNANPELIKHSGIRLLNNEPYFVSLRRGEVMEETCLRCHSTPDNAPGGLVRFYGPKRSFHRSVGDVVSAVSIRVPLSIAYAEANRFSLRLSGMLLGLLLALFAVQYWLSKRFMFAPLSIIKDKALQISSSDEHLGEQIPLPSGRELNELAITFNSMSKSLRHHMDNLEEIVKKRTRELTKTNENLEIEIRGRKKTEEALRESETKYRELVENAVLGIFQVTKEGEFLMANQRMANIFGYDSQQDFFANVDNIIKLYVNPEERPKMLQEIDEKGHVDGREMNFKRKDGNLISCNAYARSTQSEDGENIYEGLLEDITDKKQMEEELLKAKKLESLGVLAGGIAHDFNNLLTSVVGNISLAKMKLKPGSKAFENLVEAEKASIQTKELTARLITFSKGGGPIKETVPIGDLVKTSVDSSLKGSDISCRFSIPDDISPVEVDEEQMKQVIRNIITNAQEAMAGQGEINVSCENIDIGEKDTLTLKDGKYVKISIEDQGPGIPEEDFIKIFDPYFSTKNMGTQKGMGLGLAISDSIVKQHDGLITVKSELGTGTTLFIYLPALSAERPAPSAKPKGIEAQSTINNHQSSIQRILVMDDEEVVRDVSNALLTHLGYKVEVAVEGVEAIEMYGKAMESEKPFDMVILDLTNKIGMGGAETIVRLLEVDPDVRAIVATGYSNDPIISKFREHGFRGALPKPFTLDQLKTALHDAIAGE